MGEVESSAKDDDKSTVESTSITSDEADKTASSSTSDSSQPSLQSHSTPSSYASNLCALNNTGAIHFTSNTNSTGSLSQKQSRGAYSVPYPQIPLQPSSNTHQQQQTSYGTQQYDRPQ